MRSMPAITRLSYFDVALEALVGAPSPTVDIVREALSLHVEELAMLGEARLTRGVHGRSAFRNTAVDVLRELMRWQWLEPAPLADSEASYDAIRQTLLHLTPAGQDAAKWSVAQRRDAIGILAVLNNRFFAGLLTWLEQHDLAIPEWNDSTIRAAMPESWPATPAQLHDLALDACQTYVDASQTCDNRYGRKLPPGPKAEFLAEGVHAFLARRFGKRAPKTHKELVGAANHGLTKTYLGYFGLEGDANALERALAWAKDVYLVGGGRAVLGVPLWLSWSAADITRDGDEVQFVRRRVTEYRAEVTDAVLKAYAAAAQPARERGMSAPLVPIYVVRETAAYAAQVCEAVVDRVIADLLERPPGPHIVQLQLGDLRAFPPSAKPFRIGEARYYYMTIHDRSLE